MPRNVALTGRVGSIGGALLLLAACEGARTAPTSPTRPAQDWDSALDGAWRLFDVAALPSIGACQIRRPILAFVVMKSFHLNGGVR